MEPNFEKIESELDEKFEIESKLDEKYDSRFWFGIGEKDGKCNILMFYNDMFGWALSDCIPFAPKRRNTMEELFEEFDKWWNTEGKSIDDEFKAVPYPKSYYEDRDYSKVQAYFDANCKIRKKLIESVERFCENVEHG